MVGLYPLLSGLDLALEQLVAGAKAALEDALVGVYLHGSLALGDGDEWSDVDFLALTARDLGEDEERRVQELHAALFADGPVPWARRLDGSYAPLPRFRSLDPERRPFLYLDNGSAHLVRDAHCNTALIRHLVRERGIALSGPDPEQLVEPIGAGVLRAEARSTLLEYVAWAEREGGAFRRWDQAYLVLTICRVLYTAETGGVAGKRQAVAWAAGELDPALAPAARAGDRRARRSAPRGTLPRRAGGDGRDAAVRRVRARTPTRALGRRAASRRRART